MTAYFLSLFSAWIHAWPNGSSRAAYSCDGEVLLLKRNSRHNHGTWGLPGGNVDATDASLLEAAKREAAEEMGPGLPLFEVVAEVLTRRGKRWVGPCTPGTCWAHRTGPSPAACLLLRRGQKHYTVYVARISPQDRDAWAPSLNEEHSEWRWFRMAEVAAPGVASLQNSGVQLHPVVDLALRSQPYRSTVLAAIGGNS
jgi:8-oxo-dGTP pyrophosphatase MutT (NUDIX family)